MDRRSLAQELRRWAVEEMGLPQQKAPSEEMLQRLFIGQCADIWKYIIQHVRSQRTVKNIEGNLLWYQQLQHCETLRSLEELEHRRRKKLCQKILDLRSDLQSLKEQIQSAERELIHRELNNYKSQDFRRRTLMLRAYQRRRLQEWEALQKCNLQIQQRCDEIQDIHRASQNQIVFPQLEPTSGMHNIPEPKVLRVVRDTCQIRYTFLRTLYNDVVSSSSQANSEEFLTLSHKEWMCVSEKLWCGHPPYHIISSLQHLIVQTTQDLQQQQTSLAMELAETSPMSGASCEHHEVEDNVEEPTPARVHHDSGSRDSMDDLPSFSSVIHDCWSESVKVMSQVHSVDSQSRDVHARLTEKIKEIHRSLPGDSIFSALSRSAFDAEFRLVLLRGRRDTLLQERQALQKEVEDMKEVTYHLGREQQEIQNLYEALNKKQKQIQILIKGTKTSKARIRHECAWVQKFILEKMNLLPQEVVQESQRLQDVLLTDVNRFCDIYLPELQTVPMDSTHVVPAQELSINCLSNPHFSYYPIYKKIYASVGLSLYKAPETLLPHIAEMKKRLLFLHSQLGSRNRAMCKIQLHLRECQDIDVLTEQLDNYYKEQTNVLVPKLRSLIEQCQNSLEYGNEVQATVTDWWEQPAQLCLPWEVREGQTLRQWHDRWTVAVTALQRASGGNS